MTESDQSSPIRRFIGLIFVAIGIVWLITTGLCTAVVVIAHWDKELVFIALFGGTMSALIGALIHTIGRWLRPH